MKTDNSLSAAISRAATLLQTKSSQVHPARWQGMDVSRKPEMVSHEIMNFYFCAPLPRDDIEYYQRQIMPNLPWADDHFMERVCGAPLNPGKEWENWPWAMSADRFRSTHGSPCTQIPNENRAFNHTYMERMWPTFARPEGFATKEEFNKWVDSEPREPHHGIRHRYGDLNDWVRLLAHDPLTRQAWIPLFFPEDTGVADGGRKPCTLGYQVMLRDGQAHMYYPLRSCDFIRHFRDDIYLAVRLLFWVIHRCAELNPEVWYTVRPGTLAMHCTSLHVFKNDWPIR